MDWHGEPIDQYGNVECKKCKASQAPSNSACMCCCTHETLNFDEEYEVGWKLCVFCAECGKNFDFSNEELMKKYKAVKKVPS